MIRELSPDDTDARPLARVIASLSDEVGALLMQNYGGRARELAMCLTKLDEARLWAVAHGEATGSHVVMDRREMLGGMGSEAKGNA